MCTTDVYHRCVPQTCTTDMYHKEHIHPWTASLGTGIPGENVHPWTPSLETGISGEKEHRTPSLGGKIRNKTYETNRFCLGIGCWLSGWVNVAFAGFFPIGTLVVNVLGSLLLGFGMQARVILYRSGGG